MENKPISSLTSGTFNGLKDVIDDSNGNFVVGTKKTGVPTIQPKTIRQQLNMSQSQFATAFGIPLRTLQGWEQGCRKIDMTTSSYLRIISKFPNEVQAALAN